MTVVFFILVLLVLLGAKITPLHSQPSYLGYQQTLGVKGLFIALIVLSHFSAYRDDASWSQFDHIFVFIRTYLGQMTVAPFLFLSGYGVTLSIIKKGKAYLDTMAVKRIGLVMFQFLCMVALNWAISLPLGNQASLQQVLYSFVGAAEMGDNRWYGYSNWYIVVIVLLYALTWLSFLWAKGDIRKGCIALTVSAFLLTLYLGWTKLDYWHNTLPAYIGGGVVCGLSAFHRCMDGKGKKPLSACAGDINSELFDTARVPTEQCMGIPNQQHCFCVSGGGSLHQNSNPQSSFVLLWQACFQPVYLAAIGGRAGIWHMESKRKLLSIHCGIFGASCGNECGL